MPTSTIPHALCKGDTIAFISPSARLNDIFPHIIERAKTWLEQQGYRVKIIFNTTSPKDHKESVLQRCEEIHSAFRDTTVRAIVCTVGGSDANELIRHLDYDLIKANPKIFCGYSNITVLHYALFAGANLRTFYGPAALTELGDYPHPLPFTADHFLAMLTVEGLRDKKALGPVPRSLEWAPGLPEFGPQEVPRELVPSPKWEWLRPGKATGRIFGGCLPSILNLAGTKFWPDYRGRILLLETPMGEKMEEPLPLVVIQSRMADLANLGVFDAISGLVVGRPYGFDDKGRAEFNQMVADQCYGTDFPILLNVDIGHSDPILTVPLDALCSLDSEKDEFSILEAGVAE